jgi:MoaA/NifB/PqqE/SkfB family radical SAM enzyme
MRVLTVQGTKRRIPPFPHHKDYVYRCKRFFEAKSLGSFMAVARFRVLVEFWKFFRYQCGVPRDILLDPTNACNLHCTGCWAEEYDSHNRLSFEKLDSLLVEARKLGTLDILMTGGEPMVRKDEILRLAEKHRKLFFGLFTNGTLIDEPFVLRMKELGNLSVFVSIEGFREDTDFRRGEGTYDRVMEAMRLLKKHDIGFGFSLCYHTKNHLSVTSDEFLDFLREQGAWFGWAFGYRPIGKNADLSLCLDAKGRETARTRIDDYCRRKDFTIIDLFNNGHKAFGCVGAGSGYIHITANGDVEPCAFCHYSDSNIHDMSLQKALQSPFFRAFRRAQPFAEDPLRPCPLMDVPEAIVELAEANGAASTHLASPETAREFADKVRPIAKEWEDFTGKESRPLPRAELRRYRMLRRILTVRTFLAGDFKKQK